MVGTARSRPASKARRRRPRANARCVQRQPRDVRQPRGDCRCNAARQCVKWLVQQGRDPRPKRVVDGRELTLAAYRDSLATFVSLVAIAGATLLGNALNGWYSKVETRVQSASSTAAS